MIAEPYFYVVAIPALLVMGLSKGAFGSGIGSLATPMMALTVPAPDAAAIALPILMLMDVVGVWSYWKRWDTAQLRVVLPGAVIGIALGALTFGLLDSHAIGLLLGVLAVLFALDWFFRKGAERPPRPPHAGRGLFWSGLSGYTSFVAHAGGPPLAVYLLPQRLDRTVFVATTVLFFAVVNIVKVPPYAALGLFRTDVLLTALVLAPLAPIGMGLGIWLHDKIPVVPFYRICYLFMLVSGAKLIADNLGVVL